MKFNLLVILSCKTYTLNGIQLTNNFWGKSVRTICSACIHEKPGFALIIFYSGCHHWPIETWKRQSRDRYRVRIFGKVVCQVNWFRVSAPKILYFLNIPATKIPTEKTLLTMVSYALKNVFKKVYEIPESDNESTEKLAHSRSQLFRDVCHQANL